MLERAPGEITASAEHREVRARRPADDAAELPLPQVLLPVACAGHKSPPCPESRTSVP